MLLTVGATYKTINTVLSPMGDQHRRKTKPSAQEGYTRATLLSVQLQIPRISGEREPTHIYQIDVTHNALNFHFSTGDPSLQYALFEFRETEKFRTNDGLTGKLYPCYEFCLSRYFLYSCRTMTEGDIKARNHNAR